ncbi:MAG: hypothetical protein L6Q97_09340, partial [Thermoanaerobaculia bacterium]|nr:hypothetical protein [Thermoanaerobaculia bacterium]
MSKSPNTPASAGGASHIPGKKYRYPGVQPFSTEQSALFKGRDEDTERLVSLIQQEKLCVLFGKSGYGKSSLLNAGIIPALQAESEKGHRHFLPVSIRFYAASGSDDNLFKKFDFHSESALSKKYPSRHLESPALELPDTLWGRFKRRQIPPDTTIILLFDQFEEFFSYPEEQQVEFKKQLSELIYADFPDFIDENESLLNAADTAFLETKIDARAVFSIRKDRLADLDRLKDKLPAILHKRIELLPLSRQQARAALVEPAELDGDFESVKFTWSAAATDRILDALSQDKSGQEIGVEAFQLQILAEYIENRIIRNEIPDLDADGMPDVRPDDLPSDLRNVYGEYYRRKINELPEARRAVAREIIEEDLVSGEKEEDARRLSMDGVRLLSRPGADAALLNELVDTFLLRREANTIGGYNYELSHDTLLKPVLDWRDERRAENERIEVERRGLEQKARADEAERRLKEEEKLKSAALKAKKKADRNFRIAVSFSILAILAMVSAITQYLAAKSQKKIAIDKSEIADTEKNKAIEEREKAKKERQTADSLKIVAEGHAERANQNYILAMQFSNKLEIEKDSAEKILLQLQSEKKRNEDNERQAKEREKEDIESVSDGLRKARNHICKLNYTAAWDELKSISRYKVERDSMGLLMLEICFFFAEVNELEQSREVLRMAIEMLENKKIKTEYLNEPEILKKIGDLNKDELFRLEERYFPKMIDIQGGEEILYIYIDSTKIPVKIEKLKIAQTETTWWQYNLFRVA